MTQVGISKAVGAQQPLPDDRHGRHHGDAVPLNYIEIAIDVEIGFQNHRRPSVHRDLDEAGYDGAGEHEGHRHQHPVAPG